jgi:hypothetical protein
MHNVSYFIWILNEFARIRVLVQKHKKYK